jgi:hypothetical protein
MMCVSASEVPSPKLASEKPPDVLLKHTARVIARREIGQVRRDRQAKGPASAANNVSFGALSTRSHTRFNFWALRFNFWAL